MTTLSTICKKRFDKDKALLKDDPVEFMDCYQNPDDVLEWFILIRGTDKDFPDEAFRGGEFIGKIIHHPNYPFNAPDYIMLTPNGRFTPNNKICLSNSGYHKDEWSAAWNLPKIMAGFLSIMLTDKEEGISHIHQSKAERQKLALASIEYNKTHLKKQYDMFMARKEILKKEAEERKAREEKKKEEDKKKSEQKDEKKEKKDDKKEDPKKKDSVPDDLKAKSAELDSDIDKSKATLKEIEAEHQRLLELAKKKKATTAVKI